jgi:hypothetical protein
MLGSERKRSTEIIGFDEQQNHYPMRYFDDKGGSGLMHGRLQNETWTIEGDNIRFSGGFSEDGQLLSGKWEQSTDGKNWSHLMDISLVKIFP